MVPAKNHSLHPFWRTLYVALVCLARLVLKAVDTGRVQFVHSALYSL